MNRDQIDSQEAHKIARALYGITGEATPLAGELDLNFKLTADDGKCYVLKIHHSGSDRAFLSAQDSMLEHLEKAAPDLKVPRLVRADKPSLVRDLQDEERVVRLLSWLEGDTWNAVLNAHGDSELDLGPLGRNLGCLNKALSSFDHPSMHRHFPWEMRSAAQHMTSLNLVQDPDIQRMVTEILVNFSRNLQTRLDRLSGAGDL